ncbi:hypothetical protein RB595_001953 [Gaeumannomyces hyphopodioides]
MESILKCNTLTCRIELDGEVLVTDCLHVFCLPCAQNPDLWTQGNQHTRQCPACRSDLRTQDNVSVVNLRLTDEDKSRLLRGLSPAAVIDCVTSALYFWEYQMAQETAYQCYVVRSLRDRYDKSREELQEVTRDKDREIQRFSESLNAMTTERDSMRQRSEELAKRLKEKSKKLTQMQELYDGLKRKTMLDQLQDAASEAADLGLDRVAVPGPPQLTTRTLSAFYPKQAEPGYQNAGYRENRSHPSMPPGLCKVSPRHLGVPQFSDQPSRRTQGLTATSTARATMNDRSAVPAFTVSSSQLRNRGQRFDDSHGFAHHAPSGIGAGYGLNNQRSGGQARESITISNLGPTFAQHPTATVFAP